VLGSAGYGLRVGGYGVRNGRFGPQGTYRVVGMEGYVGWMLDCGVGVVSLARTGTMGSESIRLGRGVGKSRWRPRLCAVAGFRSGSVFFFPLPQGTHPGCRVRFEPQGTQCGSRTAGYARRGRVVGVRQGGSQTAGYAARFPGCRVRTHPLDRRVRRGGLPGAVGGASSGRESIFKFPHSKTRKKFQNLDLDPGSTRKSLHRTRWVYEGGREAWAGRRWRHQLPPPVQPAWGGCPATAEHPSRRSDRLQAAPRPPVGRERQWGDLL
jgi:hypothetical protein